MSGKIELQYKAKNGEIVTYMEDPYPVQNFYGKKKLLVIFQSLGDEKAEDLKKRYPYTLIDGLKFYNCRKIYVKDDTGLVGNYHLGLNGKFATEEAVTEFLTQKIKEYEILKDDIIFFGASKGGYCSLLFGYELGVKNIVAAVPQYKLYNWIKDYKNFLDYILPKDINDTTIKFYNDYLKNKIFNNTNTPSIYLLTSKNDNTYKDHIIPLIADIRKTQSELYIYENNEIFVTRHNNVVVNSLNEILTILGLLISDKKLIELIKDNNNI